MMWISIDENAYSAIYRAYDGILTVYSSCTLPFGDPRLGKMNPYIETEWGFKDAESPIIKSVATKENQEQKEYDWKYYVYL